jgi:hypothetical protein
MMPRSLLRPGLVPLIAIVVSSLVRAEPATRPSVHPALLDRPYLYEVVRHLYRWYLDEADAVQVSRDKDFVFWVQQLHPRLDPDDRSLLGQIILPKLGVTVRVKKADYLIQELGLRVTNDRFKITDVCRTTTAARPPSDAVRVAVDYADMRRHLFKTRSDAEFPEGELLTRLRVAARKRIREAELRKGQPITEGQKQIVHLAPLSPVANEAWVFWETGRLLIRFSSDFDLANPAVWDHDDLSVKLYDVDEQVVVSLDEVAGSNAYVTRGDRGGAPHGP